MVEPCQTNSDTLFIYKNKWVNILFAIYLFLGGVLFEKSCGFKLKTVYFVMNACIFFLGIVPGVVCFFEFFRKGATLVLHFNNSFSFNGPLVVLVIDVFVYFCKDDIKGTLEIIDREFDFEWDGKMRDRKSDTIKIFSVSHWFLLISVSEVLCTILVLSSRYVYVLILGDERMLNSNLSYIWANPFVEKMNSFEVYTILYGVQSFLFGAILVKGSLLPILALLICGIYYNQFVLLANSMNCDSRELEKYAHDVYTNFESASEMSETLQRSIDATFSRHFIQHLHVHRALLKYTEKIRDFIEICFAFGASVSLLVFIPGGFIVIQSGTPIVLKISMIGLFPLNALVFFICCYCAKLLDDANAALISSVYGTPWYYFSRRTGKFVHLLLNEIQHTPIQFFVFKIFPVSMTTFPRILQFNYSVLNVLRRRGLS